MTAGNTYTQLLAYARERLEHLEEGAWDAWLLFSRVSGLSKAAYLARRQEPVMAGQTGKLEKLLERRLQGEPVQYILGEWEFYSLPFYIHPGVLIPRPETETLVEQALKLLKAEKSPRVLDLCCGSGCVAISIAKHLPGAQVTAVDWYDAPLACTKENCRQNNVSNVMVEKADVTQQPDGRFIPGFDCITANPPYIRRSDLSLLAPEVLREPVHALDGDADGLRFYRTIISKWQYLLNPGGWVVMEIGYDQGAEVMALMQAHALQDVTIQKDLQGNDRLAVGCRPFSLAVV